MRGLLGLVALTFALLGGPLAVPAHAEPLAGSYATSAKVAADGSIAVTETVTFEGTPPDELTQKLEVRENLLGDQQYVFGYSGVSVKAAGGAAVQATVDKSRDFVTITVATKSVTTPIVIGYTVTGAAVKSGENTQIRLLMLQGLSIPVRTFTGTVQVPGQFSQLSCVAGPPGTDQKCKTAQGGTETANAPTFTDGPRGTGEIVAARITMPAGSVVVNEKIDRRWTLGGAFTPGLAQLLTALAVLVIGAIVVFVLHRRAGVDAQSTEITRVAEFVPVGENTSEFKTIDEIHPGHIGTLADERVDPIDVTASLLDLAVRGQLLITELSTGEFERTDWMLTRRDNVDATLRPFETELLDTIAPVGGEARVSELVGRVQENVHSIQSALYDEVVERGWFERRPDETRNGWGQVAIVVLIIAVALTGVLVAFTTFGLVGLAAVIVGLALMFVAQEMPARTTKGVSVLRGLEALRADLQTSPTDRMPAGRELQELSEVLPYAVVLGGSERWLDAIVAADTDDDPDPTDLDWYHGPENWHLKNLPDSLANFVSTVSGMLFTR